MNTIEVGSVVKLADELFYAIDSTRMASINVLDMCGIICVKNLKFE